MELQSKAKLEEAEFFLKKFLVHSDDIKKTNYFLSAFLTALRSVLDVLLYDYAEEKKIGLTRENTINPDALKIAAKILNRNEINEFLKWWFSKSGLMNQNFKVWKMRKILVHRGYPDISRLVPVYTPRTLSSGDTVTVVSYKPTDYVKGKTLSDLLLESLLDANLKDILEECKRAFQEMESIEKEAEELFFKES